MKFGPLESVPCALCGNENLKLIVTEDWFGDDFNVVRCGKCKLIFTNPRPTREWKENFYDPDINEYLQQDQREFPFQNENLISRIDVPAWDYLKTQLPNGSKLLDVGCSSGAFVRAALHHGFNASGMDYSEEAVAHARNTDNLDVFQGHVEKIPAEDNSYDIITLIQVIEHFDHPMEALAELQRVLKPGGLLYLETVNYQKLYWLERYFSFLKPLYFKVRKQESPWWKDRLPWVPFDHYYHWTPRTIRKALRKAGFQQEESHYFAKTDPWKPTDGRRGLLETFYRKTIDLLFRFAGKAIGGNLIATGRKPEH